jgi:hypothetical protein
MAAVKFDFEISAAAVAKSSVLGFAFMLDANAKSNAEYAILCSVFIIFYP